MIKIPSLRHPLKMLAARTSRGVVVAAIGVVSLIGVLAVATPSAQAAATPLAISHQSTIGHSVSPAATYWKYAGTFSTQDECEEVGLAEYESGEAIDYLSPCPPAPGCPGGYELWLEFNNAPPAALPAVSARFSAVQPAC